MGKMKVEFGEGGGGSVNMVFGKDLDCKTSAQTFHTKNAYFTAGYATNAATHTLYLQGTLIDGVLDIVYVYAEGAYTIDYTNDTLSIQYTAAGDLAIFGNLQILYDDLG